MIDILLLIAGLALILVGANYLVDGASHVAKRLGMSDFIIGMTIVGIGTSTPEMVVSFASAIKGNADIAVGNVLGSNIFNTLMILGITALFSPIALTSNNIKKDIPFSLLAAFVLCVMGCGVWLDGTAVNTITRVNGLMLLSFLEYLWLIQYSLEVHRHPLLTVVQHRRNCREARNFLLYGYLL